jgi:squalene synthase HpnC
MDRAVPLPVPAARCKTARDENFPVAAWFVAARHRRLVAAYYAFARQADDIADDPALGPDLKLELLDELEAALWNGPHGAPHELRAMMVTRGLPLTLATQLLAAFRRDAANAPINTLDDLTDYCLHSAAPVGRFMLALHGVMIEPQAADALCAALQILNHLQDARDDWNALTRCYIPAQWLDDGGISAEALLARVMSPPLRRAVDRLLDHADQLLAASAPLPRCIVDRGLSAQVRAIHVLATRLSGRLRRDDFLARRVSLTAWDWAAAFAAGLRQWASRP